MLVIKIMKFRCPGSISYLLALATQIQNYLDRQQEEEEANEENGAAEDNEDDNDDESEPVAK